MPLAEFLEDSKSTPSVKAGASPVDSAAKMRKQVFLQFGVIIALGLALAGWYVGYRVLTARAAQPLEPGAAIVVHTPVERPQSIAPQPVAPKSTPQAVEPKPAEIPAPSPPIAKPVAVASAPVAPAVTAAEVAKPVKSEQPAKRGDAPAQPSTAKPVVIARVEAAPAVAATSQMAKPVKSEQAAKRSDAPAQPSTAKPAAAARVEAAPVVAAAPEIAKPVKAPQPAKRSDAPSQPFRRHEASPRIGEKYLQIAAFGPRALDGYLKTLEGQGLHPLVAPGPADSIYRILVGPFASAEALEETRRSIQASGIEPILRTY
jgi:hypothetical protein